MGKFLTAKTALILILLTLVTLLGVFTYLAFFSKYVFNPLGLQLYPKSILTAQNATAIGTITKISNNSIEIKSDSGDKTSFKFAKNYEILMRPSVPTSTDPATLTPPIPTTDISVLQENQKVTLNLKLLGAEYQITYVSAITN